MADKIQLNSSELNSDVLNSRADKDSEKALAASLQRIHEIIELVANAEAQEDKGASTSANAATRNLGLVFSRPDDLAEILSMVSPEDEEKHPELKQLMKQAKQAVVNYRKAIEGLSESDMTVGYDTHVAPVLRKATMSALQGLDTTNVGTNAGANLATAMMFLQKFEVSISQAQADQDKAASDIGQAMINSAQDLQKTIDTKVQQAEAAAKAAADRPWWETLITVVVAVVAVVVSALTAGLGAALVAIAVGAFMASPLFSMTATAISKKIVEDEGLVKKYESEGMSTQDAEAKANAEGNIFGKIIVTAMIAVVSFGLGGITAGTDSAVDTGVEAGVDAGTQTGADAAATEATEAGAEEGALSGATKATTFIANKGLKMALLESISSLTMSNITMDAMTAASPKWVREHSTWVSVIDGIAEAVGIALTIFTGVKVMGSGATAEGMASKLFASFPKLRGLFVANMLGEFGSATMNTAVAAETAKYLQKEGDLMLEVATLEAESGRIFAINDSMTQDQSVNDTTATNITKGVSQGMGALSNDAGKTWQTSSRVLSG